jgi:hypothetical protein
MEMPNEHETTIGLENGNGSAAPMESSAASDPDLAEDTTGTGAEVNETFGNVGKRPLPVLYLPVHGLTRRCDCYEVFYRECAKTSEFFCRDDAFVYVVKDREKGVMLRPLESGQLVSKIEYFFQLRKFFYDETGKKAKEKAVNLNPEEARPLLADKDNMREYSLPLRLLSESPVLVDRGGKPAILWRGYHPDEGGVYVRNDLEMPEMSIEKAKTLLLDLFADFDFVAPADLSRAVAHLLSPAMKLGNLLGDADFPLDVALGNDSQAGKGHRMKLIQTVYGETPYTITKTKGGVGSLDEAVATALVSGKLFITLDNARGEIDSQILESILRGTRHVAARVPHLRAILAQTNRSIWELTSNGVVVPKDLTNRSVIVSNRKQPDDYKLNPKSSLGWGDRVVFEKLRRERGLYLGAVYAVLGEWIGRGKRHTAETRHDFTPWIQALDYIVTEILDLSPLMDDHETSQRVLDNPVIGWVREVMREVEKANPPTDENPELNVELRASGISTLCEDAGIALPNFKDAPRSRLSREMDRNQHIGRLLGKLYRETRAKAEKEAAKAKKQGATHETLAEILARGNQVRIEKMTMERVEDKNEHGDDVLVYRFSHA